MRDNKNKLAEMPCTYKCAYSILHMMPFKIFLEYFRFAENLETDAVTCIFYSFSFMLTAFTIKTLGQYVLTDMTFTFSHP